MKIKYSLKGRKPGEYKIGDYVYLKFREHQPIEDKVRLVVGLNNNENDLDNKWLLLEGEMAQNNKKEYDHHNPRPQFLRLATESEIQNYLKTRS